MPFTFSHPALVLPATFLPKKAYSLTGLVVGSIVPDFEYFIRMNTYSEYSHSLVGMFWFDLPLGLLLAFIFHALVRNSLLDHIPGRISARFAGLREFNWLKHLRDNWLVVIISVIFGTATHLFWDSFTHANGYFVQTIPGMQNDVNFFGYPFTLYRFFQHTSTVIGLIVIAIAIYRMPEDKAPVNKGIVRYWISAILIAFAVVGLRQAMGHHHLFHHLNQLIVTCMTGGLVGIFITSQLLGKKKLSTSAVKGMTKSGN